MNWCEVARGCLNHWLQHGEAPTGYAKAGRRGACFVSLHQTDGALRGCVGTLEPRTGDLVDEILTNSIAAASRDPRFPPLEFHELAHLHISVSILGPSEPILSTDALDPKCFGVIVTQAARRGVLLPNLEGITTPEQQVALACRKAGINPAETFEMQRFQTEVYEEFDE